jgi:hypothetical protein
VRDIVNGAAGRQHEIDDIVAQDVVDELRPFATLALRLRCRRPVVHIDASLSTG